MSPDAAVLTTSGLTKRFGAQTAVDAINLAIPHGAIYGFLGPNGSGKTTTIRMILGLVRPSAGTVSLLGHDMPRNLGVVLPKVGALVEGPAFHLYLSGRANLARLDAADPHADPRTARTRIDAALDRVGLLGAATKRYRAYSLGMRQRLGIAAALLVPRDMLVLDEPTNGLDPLGTREIRQLIGSLGADGVTILVSSHLLSEVEQVCTHLGVMRLGKLVAQGAADELRAARRASVRVSTPDAEAAVPVLVGLGLIDVEADGDGVTAALPVAALREPQEPQHPQGASVETPDSGVEPEAIVAALVGANVRVREFVVNRATLEDLFIELTGAGFDADR
jgi:ABC-2 type transport system ATP-binding protein